MLDVIKNLFTKKDSPKNAIAAIAQKKFNTEVEKSYNEIKKEIEIASSEGLFEIHFQQINDVNSAAFKKIKKEGFKVETYYVGRRLPDERVKVSWK